jgi:hypothetical protein
LAAARGDGSRLVVVRACRLRDRRKCAEVTIALERVARAGLLIDTRDTGTARHVIIIGMVVKALRARDSTGAIRQSGAIHCPANGIAPKGAIVRCIEMNSLSSITSEQLRATTITLARERCWVVYYQGVGTVRKPLLQKAIIGYITNVRPECAAITV